MSGELQTPGIHVLNRIQKPIFDVFSVFSFLCWLNLGFNVCSELFKHDEAVTNSVVPNA